MIKIHKALSKQIIRDARKLRKEVDEKERKIKKLEKKGSHSVNPFAVCTASVGRHPKKKYERCVREVKAKEGY